MNMAHASSSASGKRWMVWLGWAFTAIPALMMLFSASMKLTHNPQFAQTFNSVFGWPESTLTPLGIVELACVAVYLIPQTAVLGAIVLTGYLGGATAAHVRIGDASAWIAVAVGVVAWGGLFLRDSRLRQLIPMRRG